MPIGLHPSIGHHTTVMMWWKSANESDDIWITLSHSVSLVQTFSDCHSFSLVFSVGNKIRNLLIRAKKETLSNSKSSEVYYLRLLSSHWTDVTAILWWMKKTQAIISLGIDNSLYTAQFYCDYIFLRQIQNSNQIFKIKNNEMNL